MQLSWMKMKPKMSVVAHAKMPKVVCRHIRFISVKQNKYTLSCNRQDRITASLAKTGGRVAALLNGWSPRLAANLIRSSLLTLSKLGNKTKQQPLG